MTTWEIAEQVVLQLSERKAIEFADWLEAKSRNRDCAEPKGRISERLVEATFESGWVLIQAQDCAENISRLVSFKRKLGLK